MRQSILHYKILAKLGVGMQIKPDTYENVRQSTEVFNRAANQIFSKGFLCGSASLREILSLKFDS